MKNCLSRINREYYIYVKYCPVNSRQIIMRRIKGKTHNDLLVNAADWFEIPVEQCDIVKRNKIFRVTTRYDSPEIQEDFFLL